MKRALFIALAVAGTVAQAQTWTDPLWGTPVKIDTAKPPTGMQLVSVLLAHQAMPLAGTSCENTALKPDPRTLADQLSITLGSALGQAKHRVVLESHCQADSFEAADGTRIDGWACDLNAIDQTSGGKFVANSRVRVGLTPDTWKLIPGSLNCL
jgi:hypothetical protein